VYGVVGREIGYSLSPYIFRSAFETLGWRADYVRFDIEKGELRPLLDSMRTAPIRGLSITKPFKELVAPDLDRLDESAHVVGAVNAVANIRGRLVGYNTDVSGVVTALKPVRSRLRGGNAIIFGAGGGARAVAFALLNHLGMASVTIAARRPAQATRLIHALQDRMPPAQLASVAFHPATDLSHSLAHAEIIVNATPIGTEGKTRDLVLPVGVKLRSTAIAFDLVYRPRPTQFSSEARRAGCKTVIDGWPMLVAQAEAAFQLWTGKQFPISVRRSLLSQRQLP
jgi:shikimate dehydrogenase